MSDSKSVTSHLSDPAAELAEYAKLNGFYDKLSTSPNQVEFNLNIILKHLTNDPNNKAHYMRRSKLISCAAIVLLGLPKINHPVELFSNLSRVFSKRGGVYFYRYG